MMQNKKWPKISIVTPSYNQGEFLEQTILSVLNQKYPNLEYIIIDGGSSDNSTKIIKKYAKYLAYWHSKPDKGQSDAINQGFGRSSGEIMFWINSDDVLMPGALKLVASIFSQLSDVSWVSSLPATITSDSYINFVAKPPYYSRFFLKHGLYIQSLFGFVMQEGTFWRRSLWEKSGGNLDDVPYSMDWMLWKRFAQHENLYLIKTLLAAYRLNPNRKNNDEHLKYYNEIGIVVPKLVSLCIKFLWRKVASVVHLLEIPAQIWFDDKKQRWFYRSNSGRIRSFKLLS